LPFHLVSRALQRRSNVINRKMIAFSGGAIQRRARPNFLAIASEAT
jgi:hypothetical protein